MSRRGFSLLEAVYVLAVMTMLALIFLPRVQEVRRRAVATKIASEFQAVQLAAVTYYEERNQWPPERRAGEVPPELVALLPAAFTFERPQYRLNWEHWALPSGLPQLHRAPVLVGLSVITDDPRLGQQVVRQLGQTTLHFTRDDTYTFVITHATGL